MTTSEDIKIKLKNITKKWFYLKTEANERFVANETLNSFANYVSNTLVFGNIVDNLTSNNSSQMLSAKQGKVLNDNKEDKSNKSSSITTDTGSTTKYPSVKAVEDYAQPIGNYLTSHQDLSNYVQKSQTNGLIKNDGTIDTTSYSTFNGNYDNLTNKPTITSPSSTKPSADTTSGEIGSSSNFARADHEHPKSSIYATSSHGHTSLVNMTTITTPINVNFLQASTNTINLFDSYLKYVRGDNTIEYRKNNTYYELATMNDIPDISGKADSSDFNTLTATVNYTDNTSETVTFYIVPNNDSS